MPRLTCKALLKFCNEEFKRLEIEEFVCTKVERTRFSEDQYQGGACFLRVYFERIGVVSIINHHHFMCFYSLGEYTNHIERGYEMYLRDTGHMGMITDFTIELRKK